MPPAAVITKSLSLVDSPGGTRTRRAPRSRGDSWSAGSPPKRDRGGPTDHHHHNDADLSDLEYESQRGVAAAAAKPAPAKRDTGKPPLGRPSSRQVSGELTFLGGARMGMSGDLGLLARGPPPAPGGASAAAAAADLMARAPPLPPVGILKTAGSRQVSQELGIHKPASGAVAGGSRHVSGELGVHKPLPGVAVASRHVSGELGRVHITTRPTTGSVPSSPERDEVYHSAPASMRTSRRNSGELLSCSSTDTSPTRGGDAAAAAAAPPEGSASSGRIRNPFGSFKGEPMIKNGRIIYTGTSSFDDDDFSFEERADEVVHTVDESLYAISPIASAFVFPGSAGSTPSASPQVHLPGTGTASQKNSGFLGQSVRHIS